MSLTVTTDATTRTPTVSEQLTRLIDLGLPGVAGVSPEELRSHASKLRARPDSILVVHPCLAPPSRFATLLRHGGTRVPAVDALICPGPSDQLLYLVHGIERGDDLAGHTPEEAREELRARGRRPLTVNEGLSWLLQQQDPGSSRSASRRGRLGLLSTPVDI